MKVKARKRLKNKYGMRVPTCPKCKCQRFKTAIKRLNAYKCRACGEKKHSSKFSFYLARVDKEGFLMRSNALCNSCSDLQNKKRTKILNDANKSGLIPKKPKSGDTCQGCEREWHGNWHRHHNDETHEFVSWLCGHCNMSLSEQRGVFKQ